jgi:hypothetical protein
MTAKNYRIVDRRYLSLPSSYFRLVFFRKPELNIEISRGRWVWLCFLEVLFGAELLENLVITASNSGCPEDPDKEGRFGHSQQLSLHIPAGIFTGLFHNQIVQLLYYKFYLQYLLIMPIDDPIIDDANGLINIERVRFRLRKELLYQVITFRRVYIATAVTCNVFVDILVYWLSHNFLTALIVGACLEALRRVFKI